MSNDNVTTLGNEPFLKTLYDRIWAAIDEVNEVSPLGYAQTLGVLDMVHGELLLQSLGVVGEEEEHE